MTTSIPICYGQTVGDNWTQEWYCTKSRDASKRARHLRKLGFKVTSSPCGNQVTRVGIVRLTMLTINGQAPAPERLERI